jgi:hypothetical protein
MLQAAIVAKKVTMAKQAMQLGGILACIFCSHRYDMRFDCAILLVDLVVLSLKVLRLHVCLRRLAIVYDN